MGDPLIIEYRASCGFLEGIMNMLVVLYKILMIVFCPILSFLLWGYVTCLPNFNQFINNNGYFIPIIVILAVITMVYNCIWVGIKIDDCLNYFYKKR